MTERKREKMTEWIRKKHTDEIREDEAYGVPFLYFPALRNTGLVKHAFSTRMGGVSSGFYSTMNFSVTGNDSSENIRENYRRMAEAIGVREDSFVISNQDHTTNLEVIRERSRGSAYPFQRFGHAVDGLLTDVPGLTLVTFYADCIPLFFLDPVKKAAALSHSGWRGTLNGMGNVTVKRMQKEYGSEPEDIIACIGPGICRDCFEIGEDVAERFRKEFSFGNPESLLSGRHGDRLQLDLWEANRQVLLYAGLKTENIHITDICTHCNPDRLFSYRSAGKNRGNLAAFLSLV